MLAVGRVPEKLTFTSKFFTSFLTYLQMCQLDELRQANCQLEQQSKDLRHRVLDLEKASACLRIWQCVNLFDVVPT